jgi:hypothetical protein
MTCPIELIMERDGARPFPPTRSRPGRSMSTSRIPCRVQIAPRHLTPALLSVAARES